MPRWGADNWYRNWYMVINGHLHYIEVEFLHFCVRRMFSASQAGYPTMPGLKLATPPCLVSSWLLHHAWSQAGYSTMPGLKLATPPCLVSSWLPHHAWSQAGYPTMPGLKLATPPCLVSVYSFYVHVLVCS